MNLQSIDVGGAGDCFFRSVSHQLYGNGSHHMHIHTAGVQFMRDNPERFIESNTENSCLRYLNNMCIQGTWADALIIQAVADALKVTIQIAESNQRFVPLTTVYPVQERNASSAITLGHIDECHYVSTTALQSSASISMCNELTNDTRSSRNKHFIMSAPQSENRAKNRQDWYISQSYYYKLGIKRGTCVLIKPWVCFSVIKSCTCWDSSTLQALHEHACLFYEKCNVDREGKMPSNVTVYDVEIKIKYSHLNQGSLTQCYLVNKDSLVESISKENIRSCAIPTGYLFCCITVTAETI